MSLTLCKRITLEGLAKNMRQQTLSSTISVTLAFGAAEFENPYVLLDATACQDTIVFYMLLHGTCLSLRKSMDA